jgi:hypothetical protein
VVWKKTTKQRCPSSLMSVRLFAVSHENTHIAIGRHLKVETIQSERGLCDNSELCEAKPQQINC